MSYFARFSGSCVSSYIAAIVLMPAPSTAIFVFTGGESVLPMLMDMFRSSESRRGLPVRFSEAQLEVGVEPEREYDILRADLQSRIVGHRMRGQVAQRERIAIGQQSRVTEFRETERCLDDGLEHGLCRMLNVSNLLQAESWNAEQVLEDVESDDEFVIEIAGMEQRHGLFELIEHGTGACDGVERRRCITCVP